MIIIIILKNNDNNNENYYYKYYHHHRHRERERGEGEREREREIAKGREERHHEEDGDKQYLNLSRLSRLNLHEVELERNLWIIDQKSKVNPGFGRRSSRSSMSSWPTSCDIFGSSVFASSLLAARWRLACPRLRVNLGKACLYERLAKKKTRQTEVI